jgi:organic radical activating enzyme
MSQKFNLKSEPYSKHQSFTDFSIDAELSQDIKEKLKYAEQEIKSQNDEYLKKVVTEALKQISDNDSSTFALHSNTIEEIKKIEKESMVDYLFYRYRYERNPVDKVVDDYPPCIQIEPVSICNYRCVFCYQTDPKLSNPKYGHMGTMSVDLFKEIIDQIEGKVQAVTLASRGEPLIHKKIDEILAYMKGKFLASKINTNASLLTEAKAHAILQADLQTLVFSADSADVDSYSKLRVRGDLTKVLKNVKMFHEIKEKHYPQSKMITRVSGVKVNEDQNIKDMTGFWGDYVDQVAFVQYNPWENVYDVDVNSEGKACTDLWRRMFVWWDGIVNPCDIDYRSELKVANATNTNIMEAWNGASYSKLRDNHLNANRKECYPCDRCHFV